MSEKLFLVTGANGHLGSAVCSLLSERGERVRALVLPGEDTEFLRNLGAEIVEGDVRNTEDLRRLFAHAGERLFVIHAAGIVDINCRRSRLMEDVNENGAKNVVSLCREIPVEKLVYVSSVHAIPEQPQGQVISEVGVFDPALVHGAYAKTKAAATQIVLDGARAGVPAVVVHPSGIIGPLPSRGNHLVQLVKNYVDGKLAGCVKGGYDFVDVRDCAFGCLAAAERCRPGACYILSNQFWEIRDMLAMLRVITGGKKPLVFPMWMAKMAIPALTAGAKRQGKKPLFTKYSLYTLKANGNFSHELAARELDFSPRPLFETLKDTVAWLFASGVCKEGKHKAASRRKIAGNNV